MFKRIISIFLTASILIIGLAGCGKKATVDKSFALPISATPNCLDPQVATGGSANLIISNCFEGLVRIDENDKIALGVAKDYTVSDNGLTYTFYLREDATWYLLNGFKSILGDDFKNNFDKRVTANDFVFAFSRALNPSTKASDAVLLYSILNAEKINKGSASLKTLGVTAINDFTLEIKLAYPDSNFLNTLAKAISMPCNEAFWNATNGKYGLEIYTTLCNGPFYLSKWNENESMRLGKNENYKGESIVNPSSVWFYVNTDSSSIAQKCADGSYDASFLSQSQISGISSEKLNLNSFENITYSLVFNCKSPIFSNENARKTICYATNTGNFSLPSNMSSLAQGLVPPFCTIGDEPYRSSVGNATKLTFNENSAQTYFKKALNELDSSTLKFTVLCPEGYDTIIKSVLQEWQRILGINLVATVEIKPLAEVLTSVKDGNYSVAFCPITASEQNAVNYLSSFVSGSADNILLYSSAYYDNLFSRIKSSANNSNDLKVNCLAAENYLLQSGIILPLFNQNSYFATNKKTSGIYFYSGEDNIFFLLAEKEG